LYALDVEKSRKKIRRNMPFTALFTAEKAEFGFNLFSVSPVA
jgi:hypothetical protein